MIKKFYATFKKVEWECKGKVRMKNSTMRRKEIHKVHDKKVWIRIVQGKQSPKSIKSCHLHLYSRVKKRSQRILQMQEKQRDSEKKMERETNENSCVVWIYETINLGER